MHLDQAEGEVRVKETQFPFYPSSSGPNLLKQYLHMSYWGFSFITH